MPPAPPNAAALREGLVAKAVVGRALVGVAEHLVGLAEFLELVLGGLVAGIFVGMKFHRELAVGFLDVLGAGAAFHPQDLVIIALRGRHLIS